MAERNETVLSWDVPNLISVWLMVALLWVVMGIASHLLFRKGNGATMGAGVQTDNAGNLVGG